MQSECSDVIAIAIAAFTHSFPLNFLKFEFNPEPSHHSFSFPFVPTICSISYLITSELAKSERVELKWRRLNQSSGFNSTWLDSLSALKAKCTAPLFLLFLFHCSSALSFPSPNLSEINECFFSNRKTICLIAPSLALHYIHCTSFTKLKTDSRKEYKTQKVFCFIFIYNRNISYANRKQGTKYTHTRSKIALDNGEPSPTQPTTTFNNIFATQPKPILLYISPCKQNAFFISSCFKISSPPTSTFKGWQKCSFIQLFIPL